MPVFDLQSHSTYSDGELVPAEVAAAAAQAGIELMALTDHDSVDGVESARGAAERLGIACVTGVEISTLDPSGADLHILGYLVDPADPALREALQRSRADRETRASRMVDALTDLGYAIDQAYLDARAAEGRSIGRPHLARAVVQHAANAERLRRESLNDPTKFLVEYLIEGRPAFVARQAPSVADAIELIHGAGGVAVWAHPFWDIAADAEVLAALDRFRAAGLDGVEVFYVTHTRAQTELLAGRCAELGLLTTGSSDFHGPHHREFNRFGTFDTFGLTPNLGPVGASTHA